MTVSTVSDFTGTVITLDIDGVKITKELHVMQSVVDRLTETLTSIYMAKAQIEMQNRVARGYQL